MTWQVLLHTQLKDDEGSQRVGGGGPFEDRPYRGSRDQHISRRRRRRRRRKRRRSDLSYEV
jgi:hypothetical protein